MDGNLEVYVIFTDLSKAFDKVDPLIIILKKYDVGSFTRKVNNYCILVFLTDFKMSPTSKTLF